MKSKLLTMLAMAFPVLAQTSVKDALVKHSKTSGEFTIAVASSMPTESYNFRPDPEEMSFGQLIRIGADWNWRLLWNDSSGCKCDRQSERKKSRIACLSVGDKALNFRMTAVASDGG